MRRINSLISLAIVVIMMSTGCSMNRSVGIAPGALLLRGWQGDTGTELKLETGLSESHSDNYPGGTAGSGAYTEAHSGSYAVPVNISFGVLKRVYSGGFTDISWKVSVQNSMYYAYGYNNAYINDYTGETYTYQSTMRIFYLKQNTVKFTFPDADIELPFLKGFTFNFSMELASFSWDYGGGSFTYDSLKTTHNGRTSDVENYGTESPGSVSRVDFNTFADSVGSITFAVLYKF